MSRVRCKISTLCCLGDFTPTNRTVGRHASQIASASDASFLLRWRIRSEITPDQPGQVSHPQPDQDQHEPRLIRRRLAEAYKPRSFFALPSGDQCPLCSPLWCWQFTRGLNWAKTPFGLSLKIHT
jgi:hypothetical protein